MLFFDDEYEKSIADLRKQIMLYRTSALMTDLERAKWLGLPEGCKIRENAKIIHPHKFKCGKNIWIGEGAILDAQGGLTIDDYTQIGCYVLIWSHSTHIQAKMGKTCLDKSLIKFKPTKIGRHCFISGPTVILPGVTIGDKVIIRPMTLIDEDVPSNSVISGTIKVKRLESRVMMLEKEIKRLDDIFKLKEKINNDLAN